VGTSSNGKFGALSSGTGVSEYLITGVQGKPVVCEHRLRHNSIVSPRKLVSSRLSIERHSGWVVVASRFKVSQRRVWPSLFDWDRVGKNLPTSPRENAGWLSFKAALI